MSFEQLKNSESQKSEKEIKGKRVCAGCGRILGEFVGDGTSHGLCPKCQEKTLSGDSEFSKMAQEKQDEMKEKWQDLKQKTAQEVIDIIEDNTLFYNDKIQKLEGLEGFIYTQTRRQLTKKVTPAELKEIAEILRQAYHINKDTKEKTE